MAGTTQFRVHKKGRANAALVPHLRLSAVALLRGSPTGASAPTTIGIACSATSGIRRLSPRHIPRRPEGSAGTPVAERGTCVDRAGERFGRRLLLEHAKTTCRILSPAISPYPATCRRNSKSEAICVKPSRPPWPPRFAPPTRPSWPVPSRACRSRNTLPRRVRCSGNSSARPTQ